MGLSSLGFTPKSTDEVRTDISDKIKNRLGKDIDTSASSRIGQMIDIFAAEVDGTWEALQDIYNSQNPNTTSGVSLDHVAAITNTVRRAATSATASLYWAGDSGTVISGGSQVRKTGTEANFQTNAAVTISDLANLIIAENVADSGTITLSWDATPIAAINWDDSAATIKAAIEAHPDITDVQVTGGFNVVGGIHILFVGESLISRQPTVDAYTLERNSTLLGVEGYYSTDEATSIIASDTGALTVPALSIREIVTPIVGLDDVVNFDPGIAGLDRETDAELRDRRASELQKAGTATLLGMREAIENVPNVSVVTIIENATDVTDSDGRPRQSFEAYVIGGDDDAVAQAIYDSKPIGIQPVTTAGVSEQRSGTVTDVNGEDLVVEFSEPADVPMLVVVTGTKDSNYPADGDDQIKQALLDYFDTLALGDDVLNHLLYTPVNTVPGIITLAITQDTVAGGTPTASNTTIAATERATLIDANITVTMV